MNIIIIEDSSLSSLGGGQKITELVINILSKNHQLCLFDSSNNTLFFNRVKKYVNSSFRYFGINLYRYKNKNNFNVSIAEIIFNFLLIPVNLFLFYKNINNLNLKKKIIYCPTKKGFIYGVLIKLLIKNSYLIFHAHNSFDKKSFLSIFFLKIVKIFSDKVFSASNFVHKTLIPLNSIVINNCIQPNLQFSLQKKIIHSFNIGVCASFHSYKGIEVFIESSKLNQNNKLNFFIYGDGPNKKRLKKLSNNSCKFFGFVENMENEYTNKIDVLVVPSVAPEAFSIVIIEAMYFGIPVIATNIGAHSDLIKDKFNGLLINPNNAKSILDAINLLYRDNKLFNYIRINAKKSFDKYSYENFKKTINKEFNKIDNIS